jgi:hypothetical protein
MYDLAKVRSETTHTSSWKAHGELAYSHLEYKEARANNLYLSVARKTIKCSDRNRCKGMVQFTKVRLCTSKEAPVARASEHPLKETFKEVMLKDVFHEACREPQFSKQESTARFLSRQFPEGISI